MVLFLTNNLESLAQKIYCLTQSLWILPIQKILLFLKQPLIKKLNLKIPIRDAHDEFFIPILLLLKMLF